MVSTSQLVDTKKRGSPPSLVMPKPRHALAPARAILRSYDQDKTEVEPETTPLSPSPASSSSSRVPRKKTTYPPPLKIMTTATTAAAAAAAAATTITDHSSTVCTTQLSSGGGTSDSSPGQVYESAVESLTKDEEVLEEIKSSSLPEPQKHSLPSNEVTHSNPVSRFTNRPQGRVSEEKEHKQKRVCPGASVTSSLDLEVLQQQVEQIRRQQDLERAEWIKREHEHRVREQLMMEKITRAQDQLLMALERRGFVLPENETKTGHAADHSDYGKNHSAPRSSCRSASSSSSSSCSSPAPAHRRSRQRRHSRPSPPPSLVTASTSSATTATPTATATTAPLPTMARSRPRHSSRSSSHTTIIDCPSEDEDDRDDNNDATERSRTNKNGKEPFCNPRYAASKRSISSCSSSAASSLRTRTRSCSLDWHDMTWKEDVRPIRHAARYPPFYPEALYRYHDYHHPSSWIYLEEDPWFSEEQQSLAPHPHHQQGHLAYWSDYNHRPVPVPAPAPPPVVYPGEEIGRHRRRRPTLRRRPSSYSLGYVS
ncbi:hypothetical protein EC973_002022 [Apophysomyces ossiformis]|uniref:Uncharacterized protein n=1 Tax=Apophysomyces ossiformis TaxID=679940 RepID=A0A8H7BH72_9FUNG|nr:hypothetical protein EC973_002022 [Apophysomyces ossiformis]